MFVLLPQTPSDSAIRAENVPQYGRGHGLGDCTLEGARVEGQGLGNDQ
jgi:hypothetical protein